MEEDRERVKRHRYTDKPKRNRSTEETPGVQCDSPCSLASPIVASQTQEEGAGKRV